MSFKLKKCFIFEDSIDFLEWIIKSGKLVIPAEATNTIHRLVNPTNVTELTSFLCVCYEF